MPCAMKRSPLDMSRWSELKLQGLIDEYKLQDAAPFIKLQEV